VVGFLRSALDVLAPKGEILLTLKTTAKYNHWDLPSLASIAGLCVQRVEPFQGAQHTGYSHVRTKGEGEDGEDSGRVLVDHAAVWHLGRESPSPPFKTPAWLLKEFGHEKSHCELCDAVFTTESDYKAHLAGAPHTAVLRRVERQQTKARKAARKAESANGGKGRQDAQGVRCDCCQVTCTSSADYTLHCQGWKHRERTSTES
jgi:uncharacterized C2H2 Zn-finger protein